MQLRNYWRLYKRRSIFLIVSMQIIAVLIVFIALIFVDLIDHNDITLVIVISALLFTTITINLVTFWLITDPLKQLSIALKHSAGEKQADNLPNPNAPNYQRSGLSALLKQIYKMGSSQSDDQTDNKTDDLSALSRVFDQSNAGVVICDTKGKILYANSSAPIRTERDGNRAIDALFYTELSFSDWVKQVKKKSVRAHRTWLHIANKPPSENDRRIFDIVASYQKGSPYPIVVLFLDKTADYAPEDDQLNFISFAAHELRGPITVIRGYLDTLIDEMGDTLNQEQHELFDRLLVSSNRLSGYINNILNTSRYDQRHLNINLSETTVETVWNMIKDDMNLRAKTQGRLLSAIIPEDLPTIAADNASLGEVFGNLIDNAIKYSHAGGAVELRASPNGPNVDITIADNGIGMPSNVVGNLFHKFYRSHRSRETVAGTGIGLYISKAIVESHGGSLSVKSAEGRGSTFTISMPTYESVREKLEKTGGNNSEIIKSTSSGWIKNHGSIRG
ncbi:PAS domain-containing sensor histidine kinase [Candidatus Nomurabacteria bacterium]|nr:PAS domain-containing sensor histidine kinase [Candidatus Nomurabacteria bacterium]